MTRTLSLAHLTAIDLPPPALIRAAAEAGFDAVGLRLIRVTDTSPGYPLMVDAPMMSETRAALADTGLSVHDIEFVRIEPGTDIDALEPFLDAGATLGAHEAVVAPYDPDLSRLADRVALFAERAATRSLGVSMEFFPWTPPRNLDAALALVTQAGPRVGLLVDALHFDRSESSLETLRRVPRERLRFAHLSDAPVHPPYSADELFHTAREARLPPGEGQIDLHAFLDALPPDLPLGVEVPMSALCAAEGPAAAIPRAFAGARRLLGERP